MTEQHILSNFLHRYYKPSQILKDRNIHFEKFKCPRCNTELFTGNIGESVPQGEEFKCHQCNLIMFATGNSLKITTPFFDRWKN